MSLGAAEAPDYGELLAKLPGGGLDGHAKRRRRPAFADGDGARALGAGFDEGLRNGSRAVAVATKE